MFEIVNINRILYDKDIQIANDFNVTFIEIKMNLLLLELLVMLLREKCTLMN